MLDAWRSRQLGDGPRLGRTRTYLATVLAETSNPNTEDSPQPCVGWEPCSSLGMAGRPPFGSARRPPPPMCLPAQSLPTQNCLAQSAVGYATTNHRLARIVRRCAGEDPTRTAMSSLQVSVQARYACAQSARCRNAPTLCNVGSLRKASRWP
jgi:hypothetical protein